MRLAPANDFLEFLMLFFASITITAATWTLAFVIGARLLRRERPPALPTAIIVKDER
jgi:hypothetical protein